MKYSDLISKFAGDGLRYFYLSKEEKIDLTIAYIKSSIIPSIFFDDDLFLLEMEKHFISGNPLGSVQESKYVNNILNKYEKYIEEDLDFQINANSYFENNLVTTADSYGYEGEM